MKDLLFSISILHKWYAFGVGFTMSETPTKITKDIFYFIKKFIFVPILLRVNIKIVFISM